MVRGVWIGTVLHQYPRDLDVALTTCPYKGCIATLGPQIGVYTLIS